jgi:hypothetical protein
LTSMPLTVILLHGESLGKGQEMAQALGELEPMEKPFDWHEGFRQNPGEVTGAFDDLLAACLSDGGCRLTGEHARIYAAAVDVAQEMLADL